MANLLLLLLKIRRRRRFALGVSFLPSSRKIVCGAKLIRVPYFFIIEMKLLIAAVYTNFTTSIIDDTDIEQTDGYVGRPISNQLILKFEHVV